METGGNPSWLEPHLGTCEAIVALFHPFAEVAVHDIRRDRIVVLWNPISERSVGDASLLDELPDGRDQLLGLVPRPDDGDRELRHLRHEVLGGHGVLGGHVLGLVRLAAGGVHGELR